MWACPNCNNRNDDDHSFCIVCGKKNPQLMDNHCSDLTCEHYNDILDDSKQRYCGFCGALTVYGQEFPLH